MPVKLRTVYDAQDQIPEGFGELYVERNGKFELTGIEGVKTQADIARLEESLRKERGDHKAAKDQLAKFGELNPDELPSQLEELKDLQARLDTLTREGKIDEAGMQQRIDAAVSRAVGPLERDKTSLTRQIENIKKQVGEKEAEVAGLQGSIRQTKINGALRDAAVTQKVIGTAIDDAVLVGSNVFEITDAGMIVTKDGVGTTPGLSPVEWLKDMQEKRPHWWPPSIGGGARGGLGGGTSNKDNPWSREGWNITQQGQMVRELGRDKAADMAARVGSAIGSTKPPPAKV